METATIWSSVKLALARKLAPDAFSVFSTGGAYRGVGRQGLSNTQGNPKEVFAAFRSLVFACVNARATAVATKANENIHRVYVERRAGELEPLDDMNHPLVKLLATPNPSMTKWFMWYLIESYLCLFGNAYLWIASNRMKVPVALWILPSSIVRIVPGDPRKGEDLIKEYIIDWGFGAEKVPVPQADMLHLRIPNPEDPYYFGMSLLRKAAVEADVDQFLSEHWRDFFANDATPAGIITFPTILNDGQRKAFEAQWLDKFRKKPGEIGYLEGGATYNNIMNQKELDYLNGAGINVKRIQSVFKVPDSELMLTEKITATATLETIDSNFLAKTIEPQLTMIDGQLTLDLAKERFDSRLVIMHDNVAPKDARREKELDKMDLDAGKVSINELRERDGMERVDGGDEPLVSGTLVPLSVIRKKQEQPEPQPVVTTEEEEPEEEETEERALMISEKSWNSHTKALSDHERRTKSSILTVLEVIRKDAIDTVRKSEKANAETMFKFRVEDWYKALLPIVRREALAAMKKGFYDFKREHRLPDGMIFAERDNEIVRGIRQLANKTKTIPVTLHDELMNELQEGLDRRENVGQLADRVSKFFDDTNDHRAERIARTNSNYAVNKGNELAALRSGIFTHKVWLTMRDDDVRDGHQELDGVVVPIGKRFRDGNTGDWLSVPGDPTAKHGASVINCRCTVIFKRQRQ